MAWHIRPAAAIDADAVLRCLAEAFAPFESQYSPEGFIDTVLSPATVSRRLAEMTVLVAASEDGTVGGTIGYACQPGGEGHIRGMAVRPLWQGRGVAQQLLATAERDLRALGCRRAYLETTEPLHRAVRFYERNGYATSGKVSDFYGMPLFEYVKVLMRG